jgi:hypothetical protein
VLEKKFPAATLTLGKGLQGRGLRRVWKSVRMKTHTP